MQAERVGAAREEWQRKLTTQQEQFALGQKLQQEQIFRQQQASEFATIKQSQAERARLAAQQEQFKQNLALQQQQTLADMRAREQAFSLQEAQEARLYKSTLASMQQNQVSNMLDLTKIQETRKQKEYELTLQNQYIQQINTSDLSPDDKVRRIYAVQQGAISLPALAKPGREPIVRPYSVTDVGRIEGYVTKRFDDISMQWTYGEPEDTTVRETIKSIYNEMSPTNEAQATALSETISRVAQQDNEINMKVVSDELTNQKKSFEKRGGEKFTSMEALINITKPKTTSTPSSINWGIGTRDF